MMGVAATLPELSEWTLLLVWLLSQRINQLKSVQSALSDLKRLPERLQSQCNYLLFIT